MADVPVAELSPEKLQELACALPHCAGSGSRETFLCLETGPQRQRSVRRAAGTLWRQLKISVPGSIFDLGSCWNNIIVLAVGLAPGGRGLPLSSCTVCFSLFANLLSTYV